MSAPRIEILDDADALASAVAHQLLTRLEAGQAGSDDPQVALTGGSIADRIHLELGSHGPESAVDWGRVGIWWGDERFVASGSGDRNALAARRGFLDHVAVTPGHVHEVPASDHAASVADAAAAYDRELREHLTGRFTVVMLGLGPDGHVASLFPGHPALDVGDRLAVPVVDSPKPPPERISLTFRALSRAQEVWFVVSGEDKADAVSRTHAPEGDVRETPARGVVPADTVDPAAGSPAPQVVWFLDRAAASRL